MRRLSNQALEAAERLIRVGADASWFPLVRRHSEIFECLAILSRLKEPGALACVSRLLFSKSRSVRSAAIETLCDILYGIAPLELVNLSVSFEWEYLHGAGRSWSHLRPSQVASMARCETERGSVAVLGLLSFHHSGYVREEAVRQLSGIFSGRELPFLLIRQNDWVTKISSLAQEAVEQRLSDDYATHLAASVDLLLHLPECGRRDLVGVSISALQRLLEERHDGELQQALTTGESKTQRLLVKLGLELPGDHIQRLARHGLKSDDVVVRLLSARQLLQSSYTNSLAEKLIREKFAPIRREAYKAMAARQVHSSGSVWVRAAFDRCAGTRDLARFHLRKLGETDLHQLYVDKLKVEPDSLQALSGLAECAKPQHVGLLHRYTKHGMLSRRRAAMHGLVRLVGDGLVDPLVDWLSDESPSVARQAARSLKEMANVIDPKRLFVALKRSSTDQGKQAITRLFFEMGKWMSLPWLIRATGLQDPIVTSLAESFAEHWLLSNTVFRNPTQVEREELQAAYREVGDSIPATFVEKLEAYLPFTLGESDT